MKTRQFLPNPNDYIVRGFFRRWWTMLSHPWIPVIRFRDYIRAVEAADAHNQALWLGHIHEIDRMHNWLGEHLYTSVPVNILAEYCKQIQAGYTTVDGCYPWAEVD